MGVDVLLAVMATVGALALIGWRALIDLDALEAAPRSGLEPQRPSGAAAVRTGAPRLRLVELVEPSPAA